MRNRTPFFAAFAPLLFGRPPRSFRTALRQSVLKADSLSQWRAAFASMIPDSLLAPKKKGAWKLKESEGHTIRIAAGEKQSLGDFPQNPTRRLPKRIRDLG